MTDWIEHTTETCPVDPETVVEVRMSPRGLCYTARAGDLYWDIRRWSHYRIITPAKPPEPEMVKTHEDYTGPTFGVRPKPEPDLITLRLECLKLAVNDHFYEAGEPDYEKAADRLLHYVLNGSVDKA
jgi:hypothetical protein